MERKIIARGETKQLPEGAPEGSVLLRFARFETVDSDFDITTAGAFGEQQVLMSDFGHSSWQQRPTIGKGRVYEDSEGALFEGQFNLGLAAGRDAYQMVAFNGGLQEWSYGLLPEEYSYERTDSDLVRRLNKVKVFEVSPVLAGAGHGTATLDLKRQDPAANEPAAKKWTRVLGLAQQEARLAERYREFLEG